MEPNIDQADLAAWVDHKDEAALERLVSRHVLFVLGTCQRVLGANQDADDACQATFLAMAEKASSIRDPARLTVWLHRTAVRACLYVQRSQRSRQRREEQAMKYAVQAIETTTDDQWEAIRPHLDQALDSLPGSKREVLIRHYLHQEQLVTIARALDITPQAALKRRDEGLVKLQRWFARRGLATGTLTTLLAAHPLFAESSTFLAASCLPSGAQLRVGSIAQHLPINGKLPPKPIVAISSAVALATVGILVLTASWLDTGGRSVPTSEVQDDPSPQSAVALAVSPLRRHQLHEAIAALESDFSQLSITWPDTFRYDIPTPASAKGICSQAGMPLHERLSDISQQTGLQWRQLDPGIALIRPDPKPEELAALLRESLAAKQGYAHTGPSTIGESRAGLRALLAAGLEQTDCWHSAWAILTNHRGWLLLGADEVILYPTNNAPFLPFDLLADDADIISKITAALSRKKIPERIKAHLLFIGNELNLPEATTQAVGLLQDKRWKNIALAALSLSTVRATDEALMMELLEQGQSYQGNGTQPSSTLLHAIAVRRLPNALPHLRKLEASQQVLAAMVACGVSQEDLGRFLVHPDPQVAADAWNAMGFNDDPETFMKATGGLLMQPSSQRDQHTVTEEAGLLAEAIAVAALRLGVNGKEIQDRILALAAKYQGLLPRVAERIPDPAWLASLRTASDRHSSPSLSEYRQARSWGDDGEVASLLKGHSESSHAPEWLEEIIHGRHPFAIEALWAAIEHAVLDDDQNRLARLIALIDIARAPELLDRFLDLLPDLPPGLAGHALAWLPAGHEGTIDRLEQLTKSQDPSIRAAALVALSRQSWSSHGWRGQSERTTAAIRSATTDENPLVRSSALYAAQTNWPAFEQPEFQELMQNALETDLDPMARSYAAIGLSRSQYDAQHDNAVDLPSVLGQALHREDDPRTRLVIATAQCWTAADQLEESSTTAYHQVVVARHDQILAAWRHIADSDADFAEALPHLERCLRSLPFRYENCNKLPPGALGTPFQLRQNQGRFGSHTTFLAYPPQAWNGQQDFLHIQANG